MPLHGENLDYPAYTQIQRIRGGGALVHKAQHTGYDLPCVQKTYPRPGREDALAFIEPRLLRELKHQHIVEIIDAQPDGDRREFVTMVMPEYVGGDLLHVIADGRQLSVGQAIEWAIQIATALDYLHTVKGYLHRDIKPGNVVIDASDKVLVCDFGSAARTSSTGHTAAVRATYLYQPPEVARHGWMSTKSDIYSLGLTLIELLDGRFLYEGLDAAAIEARLAQGKRGYSDRALSSRARSPHVPPVLRTVLSGCIAPDPDARPTAAELVTTLEHLRFVDWLHDAGDGLDGHWTGGWPPRARADAALELRVTSRLRLRGANAGRRELRADYRRGNSASWRTVGSSMSPSWVDAQDDAAVSRFFSTVVDKVAQRFPS